MRLRGGEGSIWRRFLFVAIMFRCETYVLERMFERIGNLKYKCSTEAASYTAQEDLSRPLLMKSSTIACQRSSAS